MFISRKLAMGTGAQAEGDPLCTHPHWQGTTQRSPFFCRHQPGQGKKGLIFSKGSSHDHDQNYRNMGSPGLNE